MRTVNVTDARTHLGKLLDQAQAGEEIVITRRGQPVARLRPIADTSDAMAAAAALTALRLSIADRQPPFSATELERYRQDGRR
jgi:prevent-host-death family protein